jgi:hypothetical protein
MMPEDQLQDGPDSSQREGSHGQPASEADDEFAGGSAPRRAKSGLRSVVAGMVLGTAVGLVGTLIVLVLINRGQPPIMTAADFEAAVARWKEHGPESYDLDFDVGLDLVGKLRVEVRRGEVAAMTLEGQPTRQHIWDSWSVPGLFEIIRLDLARNQSAAKNPEGPKSPPVLQQAEFDPELGFPRRYRRTELSTGQWGQWQISRFQSAD